MGVGSSRDSEVRGPLIGGNSVVLTDGIVAAESERFEYAGDLGVRGVSLSNASGAGCCFSTEGTTADGAVIERLGAVRPVVVGGT